MTRARRSPGRWRRSDGGVLALEFALLLPVVGLLLVAVVLAGVHAVDQLVVQEAARAGARVAAVTRLGEAPRLAAVEAAAPRVVVVGVVPPIRRRGETVRVTVTHTRDAGFVQWTVTATASALVEPVVGG